MRVVSLSVVTAPAAEPVDLATIKLHTRSDVAVEEPLLTAYSVAARQVLEEETRRAFVSTTLKATYSDWGRLYLPRSPLVSVSSVKYYDDSNTLQTLSSDVYTVVDAVQPYIELTFGQTWPTLYTRSEAVEIEFVAGYGDAADVPDAIKMSILLLTADMYEHRESGSEVKLNDNKTVERLMWPYRVLDQS